MAASTRAALLVGLSQRISMVGEAGHGVARPGAVWQGRRGRARHGKAGLGKAGWAWRGKAGPGMVWLGEAWQAWLCSNPCR